MYPLHDDNALNRAEKRRRLTSLKRNRKSYFVMSNSVLDAYKNRVISAVDTAVLAYLHSVKRQLSGVCLSQKRIAAVIGITVKTVRESIERLYKAGFITDVIGGERQKKSYKFFTNIYVLKPLPNSGFFFVPRNVWHYALPPKNFVVFLDFCRANSFEFGKSWNSYNDLCERLGFVGQRSKLIKLVNLLVEYGLIVKKSRRIKNVFVDNIYRVAGYEKAAVKTYNAVKKAIVIRAKNGVATGFKSGFYALLGVGRDFTHNILNKMVGGRFPGGTAVRPLPPQGRGRNL